MIVYVIAQDSAVRRALHRRLNSAGHTAWPFAHTSDFLEQVADLQPAPIMTDLATPQNEELHLSAMLSERGIDWPLILMTATADTPMTVEAMHDGAVAVLEHPLRDDLLTTALDQAFAQLCTNTREVQKREAARALVALLTPRERSVVRALIDGKTNKVIATELAISARTVEGHRAHALRKLNVRSIAEMVYLAVDGDLDLRAHPLDPG